MVYEDFPKMQSPFIRKENDKGEYVVTPEINPGFEWVFEDDSVMAIEKLHGTNVGIGIKEGNIIGIWNRETRIPFFNRGKKFIIDGILTAFDRNYIDQLNDGYWYGELIGPKVNGNPYVLDEHTWIPFATYAKKKLAYKSWGKYPKTYDSISEWFKTLMPLYSMHIHGHICMTDENGEHHDYEHWHEVMPDNTHRIHEHFVEGVVFTHPDGRMAKLRRDMFDWYSGPRHEE